MVMVKMKNKDLFVSPVLRTSGRAIFSRSDSMLRFNWQSRFKTAIMNEIEKIHWNLRKT